MKEYMVYTKGDSFQINADKIRHEEWAIVFMVVEDGLSRMIAEFNWNNIVGWEEKREDVK